MTDTATETVRQLLRDESTPEGRAFWAKVRAVGDTAPEWMKEKIRQAMSDEGDTSNPTETAADAVRPDLDGIEARANEVIADKRSGYGHAVASREYILPLLAYCRRLEATNTRLNRRAQKAERRFNRAHSGQYTIAFWMQYLRAERRNIKNYIDRICDAKDRAEKAEAELLESRRAYLRLLEEGFAFPWVQRLMAENAALTTDRDILLHACAEETNRADKVQSLYRALLKASRDWWLAHEDFLDAHSPRRFTGEAQAEYDRAQDAWGDLLGDFPEWDAGAVDVRPLTIGEVCGADIATGEGEKIDG